MATYFKTRYGLFFASLCFYVKGSDTQCGSSNRFGPNCDFECHCLNGEQCNISTGNCPSGCDFDWVGPGCQRRNIVPIGRNEDIMVTRHQSNIEPRRKISALAVDRDLSTCSFTNYANKSTGIPWWRIWLKDKHRIRHISIVTGNEFLDYFKNFKVMVENTTVKYWDGFSNQEVCYTHDKSAPRTTSIDVTCTQAISGNQIRIRLATNGTQLVLCDVRIYGECTNGTFGKSCTDKCSTNCQTICDKDNGTCAVCKPGWTGERCDKECDNGKYGKDCKESCSQFCKRSFGTACNSTNGHCLNGCTDGYTGYLCNSRCPDGTYGFECSYNCSKHCFNGSNCINTNGTCINGCDTGWTGNTCKDACDDGKYGTNCVFNCSGNCRNNSVCSKKDGSCEQGCKTGYKGKRCNEKCRNGSYGTFCHFNCSTHCLNGAVCLHTNGSCTNGCKPGWTGDTCMNVCVDGYYGHECMQKCSVNCVGGYLNCDNVFGSCMSGCVAGWTGRKCDEVCPAGRWGINCANTCGHCVLESCRHTGGVCEGGCAAGAKNTPHCDEECIDGSFGINCSGFCSNNCKDVCRKETGECTYCKSGWHGAKCTQECEDGRWGENCKRTCLTCRNETCNRISGACYSHCKPGFKQTEYCDQECSNGWFGLNCSEECNGNCKDVTFCRKTDGSCIECKPGLEGKICDKAVKQVEKMMHIFGGGIAAIVLTVTVLIFFSVVVTVFIMRKRLHINHNKTENETVSYSNVVAAEISSTVLKTPESNLNVEMENVYDIIKRTSGIEHNYG